MPDEVDAILAQYIAEMGDVPASRPYDNSTRLTRESLKKPSLVSVLQCALRDGAELDDDLRRVGAELGSMFHAGGLPDVLAWVCFATPDEGVALACEIVRGMLDSGEVNVKTEAARKRAGQLREAVEAVVAGEPLFARRCRNAALAAQRNGAITLRDEQVVKAAKWLIDVADVDHTLFCRVTDAACLARDAVVVSTQWAERFVPLARARTQAPSFDQIEAWRATHPYRGAFRNEIHMLVTQMSAGPVNLRGYLFEHPISRQSLADAWRSEHHLDVLLPLAAAVASDTPFAEDVRSLVPDAAPPVLTQAVAAMEIKRRFVSVSHAFGVGYLLGPSAELAQRFREQMGTLDLYGGLTALAASGSGARRAKRR